MRHLFTRVATVEPYEGSGAYGPIYGDPVEVPCWVSWARELVRDADGNEVVSSGQMLLPLHVGPYTWDEVEGEWESSDVEQWDEYPEHVDVEIPPESRVTVDGHTTTVIGSQVAHTPRGPHHREARLR